jgi:hypothetical protein
MVGLVGLALVAVLAVRFWPRPPRPCFATFQQARPGMTLEDVVRTVGGPPTGGGQVVTDDGVAVEVHQWDYPDGLMSIQFDADGRADQFWVFPQGRPPNFWDGLRAQLGL